MIEKERVRMISNARAQKDIRKRTGQILLAVSMPLVIRNKLFIRVGGAGVF